MEFRHLHYFVAVAQELHFGRAAQRLQMTQPALSKQIKALEQELSVQLFFRTKRLVQLTPAGQVFFEQAQRLLEQAQQAVQLAQRAARGEVGQLTLGFTETATYTVLPKLVRQYRERYPQVELSMQELSTEAQVVALKHQQIDLAFLHPPIDERGLSLYPLLKESFVVVLPKQHRLVQKERLSLSAIAEEAFILHPRQEGPVLYNSFVHSCQRLGFQPNIVKENGSHRTRICLVAAGMGITFIPESVQTLAEVDVECKPIEDSSTKLELAAAWRQDNTGLTLQEFLAVMLNAAKF